MTGPRASLAQRASVRIRKELSIDRNKRRLNRHLDRWQGRIPDWAARAMAWLRKPSSRWVRIPVGLLLIAAGIVGIVLPVLGFWMVIPGLLLLAIDVPFLRLPVRAGIVRTRYAIRWFRRRRRSRSR